MPWEGGSSKKRKKRKEKLFATNQQIHGTCFFGYIYHLVIIIECSAQDVKFNKF